jgi:hypothetical protein
MRLRNLLGAIALLAALLPGQADAEALAAALVRAQVPARDDPDARARDLLAAAAAAARSPIAALLVAEAARGLRELQDPAAVLADLAVFDGQRLHGLCALEVATLRWRLQRALSPPAAAARLPGAGHAERLLAVGPFGDGGSHFVGVPFAPEFEFPEAGRSLPGAGRPATARVARRGASSWRIDLQPPHAVPGCCYGRWRVVAAAPTTGFLEVEHEGDLQVFVDGAEVLRVVRAHESTPRRHYLGLDLPAGGHEVVVKTATAGQSSVALRFVDAEGAPLPGVQPDDGDAFVPGPLPATTAPSRFVTGAAMLARLATAPDASANLRIAATLAAVRDGSDERAIDLAMALLAAPPDDPERALAFARVLRLVPLPEEFRNARARALEEAVLPGLLPAHHTARLVQAQLLEEQDQREQAVLLLRAHPAPGPATFDRQLELLRALRFGAEIVPTLQAWIAACPRDARPHALWAAELDRSGAHQEAAARRARSLALRPDQTSTWRTHCQDRLRAAAPIDEAAIAAAWPGDDDDPPLGRLMLRRDWAIAIGDDATARALGEAIAAHPEADARLLAQLAAFHVRREEQDSAIACLERALPIAEDPRPVRTWLAMLRGQALAIDQLAAFRRDGDAAIAAFTAGERERQASTTLLIDQHLLAIEADGSLTIERHELRRINDQAGVEAFREAAGLGRADEVLLVRTRSADGSDWVPSRVDDDYAPQRLAPGAFVEWRWRNHRPRATAAPFAPEQVLFGSDQEPCAVRECVVVLPTGRGELRTRDLGAPNGLATLDDGRTVHVYRRQDMPSLPKERHLPPLLELVPSLAVGEDEAPYATLRAQREELARRTRLSAPLREAAAVLVAGLDDPGQRARAIWDHCQQTIEDGPVEDALQTLLRRKGNRLLLATALWRAAGLVALPLACRQVRPELDQADGSLFADDAAVQFPGVLLELPDGRRLPVFADVPRHWPLGTVPAVRSGLVACVARDDRFEPLPLPAAPEAVRHLEIRGRASLRGQDLVLIASARIGDAQGYGLAEQLRQQKANVRTLAARQIAQQLFPGFRVDAAALADDEPGQPLRLDLTLRRPGAQAADERLVLPLPLPQSRLAAALGDRAERTQPWRLPVDLLTDIRIEFDPGADMRFTDVPPPSWLAEGPLEFQQDLRPQDGRLVIDRRLRIGPAWRPAGAFGAWLRALAAIDRAEQQTIELAPRAR